ncbi:uncharacterized protein MYCGRDRAFT_70550 [Zymoseptoria tritici IPO323]|uniref:Uncharacterized protein n=1 Tax=Zymoseptoria tritici (strain CBS 115943 / IPO323) TaxID=336722 RepID=F9X7I8_ZYMTI|nr:uncharacterized protein MYCGRDRAFT_70550 [Zymoseptoria tritici IPO323]EGP89137.1 hypothetical protein MYCGRDRAFT_70550 [Zymoseptoria tritici IPO323]
MNTRQAIQPSNTPNVLSISISASRKRFIAGLADGFRVFRLDNCLTTYHPALPSPYGASITAVLDDRYVAYVPTHKSEDGSGPNVVIFWDCVLERELTRFDLHEQVLGLRLSSKWLAVILQERTILFQHQEIQPQAPPSPPPEDTSSPTSVEPKDESWRIPNRVHSLHNTSHNPFALCCLTNDLLVLPAQSTGQIQLISLLPKASTNKRVVRAHNSSLRAVALSPDGSLLVTTSEQGTLLRVFTTSTLDQIAEFRRGLDHAIIYDLAFSPGNRWLASTSDKGTLHVFDLRPSDTQNAPFASRLLSDSRSAASHSFHLGSDPAHWQTGRPEYSWTVLPSGGRKRVRNEVQPRPGEPSGRAVKGVLTFMPAGWNGDGVGDASEESVKMVVIGGGVEGRWEEFQLRGGETGGGLHGWILERRGFRRFLTRQFVE